MHLVEQPLRALDRRLLAALLIVRAQFLVKPRPLRAQLLHRLPRLVLETRLTAIEMVEATRDLARELDVRHLILANRHLVGAVDQDVCRLQEGVAEEAIGRQILVLELLLLILVGRHPLQPAERRHHRQQQMQFGVLRHLRLDEEDRPPRVDASRQPVDDHVAGRADDPLRVVVLGRQRVPVGDEEEAGVVVLQPDPVLQDAVVVTEMQAASRAHSGEDSFCVHVCLRLLRKGVEKGLRRARRRGASPASAASPAHR
ncbi:MAG: hypothetical protein AW07_02196 [Candidatus Accumulibacter sp. SK-11]|nr:MAG: hypothetical protein AW07_02196 [Candidatus Accumulibacter sp. SK-11]